MRSSAAIRSKISARGEPDVSHVPVVDAQLRIAEQSEHVGVAEERPRSHQGLVDRFEVAQVGEVGEGVGHVALGQRVVEELVGGAHGGAGGNRTLVR